MTLRFHCEANGFLWIILGHVSLALDAGAGWCLMGRRARGKCRRAKTLINSALFLTRCYARFDAVLHTNETRARKWEPPVLAVQHGSKE